MAAGALTALAVAMAPLQELIVQVVEVEVDREIIAYHMLKMAAVV